MRVFLVQSGNLASSGLPTIVRELIRDVEIVETNDAVRMICRLGEYKDIDLLIAEYHLAHVFWFVSQRGTATSTPTVGLVAWSASPSHAELLSAFQLGVRAYLPGTASPAATRAALQAVMAGGSYFPQDLLIESRSNQPDAHSQLRPSLTPRQAEVLHLMAAGKSNKEIARELGMSAGTAKVHVTAILKALKVRNRTQAVITHPQAAAMLARALPHSLRTSDTTLRTFQNQKA